MKMFLNFRHIKLLIKNKLTVISIIFFFNLKYFGGSRNRLYLSRWVAYLKCIKNHNSYDSCERCVIRGRHVEGRIVSDEQECPTRSD